MVVVFPGMQLPGEQILFLFVFSVHSYQQSHHIFLCHRINHSFCCFLNIWTFRPIPALAGIALSNGYMWKKQRKFANTHLRYFGEGQKSSEHYIQVESNFLCEAFKDEQGTYTMKFYVLLSRDLAGGE